MKNQSKEFESESYRYISSYIDRTQKKFILAENEYLLNKKKDIKTILDVGCGNGNCLEIITDSFEAKGKVLSLLKMV